MKIRDHNYRTLSFYCPACNRGHSVTPDWGYNENPDVPTFSKHSIGVGSPSDPDYCHSYIKDGMIKFELDSKHSLAGKTVPLPDFPENYG